MAGRFKFWSRAFGALLLSAFSMATVRAAEVSEVSLSVTGGTNAVLSGAVVPDGMETGAWFEWGDSPTYGSNTTVVVIDAGTEAAPVVGTLEGLVPERLYHVRLVATNAAGRFASRDRFFVSPTLSLKGTDPATNFVGYPYIDAGISQSAPPVAMGAGFSHSLVVRSDGTIAGFGQNSFGQATNRLGLSNVVAVTGGFLHSVALGFGGTVFAWGGTNQGQTFVPPELTNALAIGAGEYHSLAATSDGSVYAWGKNDGGQTNIPPGLTNAIAVAGGTSHSYALLADHTVVGWGANDAGQINVPPTLTNAVALASGRNHGLALTREGMVVAWGFGASGQTNVPSGLSNVVAITAGYYHNLALKADGSVVAWGLNNDGQTTLPAALSNAVVVAVAAGGYHNLARTLDGTLVGWGRNSDKQSTIPAGLSSVGGGYSIGGEVDTNTVGRYELTYYATNYLGGANTITRTVEVVPSPPLVLAIVRSGTNTATVSWEPPIPGFMLQHASSVTNSAWIPAVSGETNPVTIGLSNEVRFYRLNRPL